MFLRWGFSALAMPSRPTASIRVRLVRVAGDVGGAAFDAAAVHAHANHVGTAVADEHRRLGEAGVKPLAQHAFIAAEGGREHGAGGGAVFEHAGKEVVGEFADAAAAWVFVGYEEIDASLEVGATY